MRFFSRGWADGDLTEEECEAQSRAYAARLEAIAPELPPPLLCLVREVGLHDAVIEQLIWSGGRRSLRARFVAGTSERGYVSVTIDYLGALLGRARLESLRRAASRRETVVLQQEVDIDVDARTGERLFVHRLLFWPSEEVTIDCEGIVVAFEPRADPRVALGGAFVDEPGDTRGDGGPT